MIRDVKKELNVMLIQNKHIKMNVFIAIQYAKKKIVEKEYK